MIRKTYSILLLLFCCMTSWAQQTIDLPASPSDSYHPSIQVFLPAADKANGCAVILCQGSGSFTGRKRCCRKAAIAASISSTS